ncbi:MAG: hypothetical protein OEZ58_02415 [Gammaproteobacteria bacterium]|nr:hypothetical protein [Gammaproteobacteria bacterium]MDH5727815.1 hypothetical protein [Gammaproteobacteria bacterium]
MKTKRLMTVVMLVISSAVLVYVVSDKETKPIETVNEPSKIENTGELASIQSFSNNNLQETLDPQLPSNSPAVDENEPSVSQHQSIDSATSAVDMQTKLILGMELSADVTAIPSAEVGQEIKKIRDYIDSNDVVTRLNEEGVVPKSEREQLSKLFAHLTALRLRDYKDHAEQYVKKIEDYEKEVKAYSQKTGKTAAVTLTEKDKADIDAQVKQQLSRAEAELQAQKQRDDALAIDPVDVEKQGEV